MGPLFQSVLAIGYATGSANGTNDTYALQLLLIVIIISAIFKKDKPSKPRRPFVDIITLHDASEEHTIRPNPEAIFKLCKFEANIGKKAIFSYVRITGTQIVAHQEQLLVHGSASSAANPSYDVFYRCDQVRNFKDGVSNIIENSSIAGHTSPVENVECFRTIAEYLNVFNAATTKIMLVHSALLERSDLFDHTKATDRLLLAEHPKKLAARFKAAYSINKLDGVTVTFINKPLSSAEAEQYYLQMVGVYTSILTGLGAEVHVQSFTDMYLA